MNQTSPATPAALQENQPPPRRTAQYMTLLAALLGWMFDGFEMGLFPLIGAPALRDLLGPDSPSSDAAGWFGAIIAVFLVGAAAGGVLFGWLGDKIGRVRAMSLSIFTYAIFTGLCGFATEAWHIAVLRFIASLGMGGEWSLGVALVNEIWPGKSRAFIAGLIGAASNVGFLMVALLSVFLTGFIESVESFLLMIGLSDGLIERLLQNQAWRFLMICGAFPALLIFLIRLFVPESQKWQDEHDKGNTSNWVNSDLYGLLIGCLSALLIIWTWSPPGSASESTGWLSTLFAPLLVLPTLPFAAKALITVIGMAVCLIGFLYPVLQYLKRSVAGSTIEEASSRRILGRMLLGAALAGTALLGTWGSIQWAPRWAAELQPDTAEMMFYAKEKTQIALSLGAIAGTILAAVAAGAFGRRRTFTVMCLGSIASAVYFYLGHDHFGFGFLIAAFLAGGVTASFYGFFPLYFPELFPTAVRATGQGFAFNFGRIVAAIGGLQTASLIAFFDGDFPSAGSALSVIYLLGAVLIWFGPETKNADLND